MARRRLRDARAAVDQSRVHAAVRREARRLAQADESTRARGGGSIAQRLRTRIRSRADDAGGFEPSATGRAAPPSEAQSRGAGKSDQQTSSARPVRAQRRDGPASSGGSRDSREILAGRAIRT